MRVREGRAGRFKENCVEFQAAGICTDSISRS